MFPPGPISQTHGPGGTLERRYDTNADGRADFAERLNRDGIIDVIRFDPRGDGSFDDAIDRLKLRPDDCRDLFIILDSVPYSMVVEQRDAGRFRYFHPPARVIAPFPVMTDVSLCEFFGRSPCPGVEAAYYNGKEVTAGYDGYLGEAVTPWSHGLDYRMTTANHLFTYFWPNGWFGHELHDIQTEFLRGGKSPYLAYCVGTSALGALEGRNGHHAGLSRVDRFCQQLMHDTRGRLRITLMSDHGHHFAFCKRVPIEQRLTALGYRITGRLEKRGDVIPIEFGLVSSVVIYTQDAEAVARDCLGIEGVELSAWCDTQTDEVVVLSRDGEARIGRKGDRFSYRAVRGDPLRMLPIMHQLGGDAADDAALWNATKLHHYPDALHRLWRAFHGLVQHQPQVMLSLQDDYYCGTPSMNLVYTPVGLHGSLNLTSSSGFCMTTIAPLPEVVRMDSLRGELQRIGLTLPEQPQRR